MYRETYRGDLKENPEGFTPTFYGVDRKERLENHLTEAPRMVQHPEGGGKEVEKK